jgi:hypothetical protein
MVEGGGCRSALIYGYKGCLEKRRVGHWAVYCLEH